MEEVWEAGPAGGRAAQEEAWAEAGEWGPVVTVFAPNAEKRPPMSAGFPALRSNALSAAVS